MDIEVIMPKPTPDQLAKIRSLLPPKTDNVQNITVDFEPLLTFLRDLDPRINPENDQEIYTAGWSILWGARSVRVEEIESAYDNAVSLRSNGDGGGHGALIQILQQLGYRPNSSEEAERIACAVIEGQI